MNAQVAIIMGSISDRDKMIHACHALEEFGVGFVEKVVSAHRTPEEMVEFAKSAKEQGFKVIIAGAGGAAHLPGMVASLTTLPVIGVPISLKNLDGLDSLMSIVQMPKGVPVATVAVDNAFNAGLLAIRCLAIEQSEFSQKLKKYQDKLKSQVDLMNRDLQKKDSK